MYFLIKNLLSSLGLLADYFYFYRYHPQRHLVYFALISVWPISIMLSSNNYKKSYNRLLYISFCMILSISSYLLYNKGNTLYIKSGLYKIPTLSQATIKHINKKLLEM